MSELENHEFETIAEAIGHFYTGEVVQIYLGETGGTTNYSDFDLEQKIYIEGKVNWAKGMVISLTVDVSTQNKPIFKTVLINAWSITAVMLKGSEGIQISHIMRGNALKGTKR